MHHPIDRIAHTTAFVTPVVEHWLEREIVQWVDSTKDRSDDRSHHEWTLLPQSYISLVLDGMRNSSMGPPWRIDPTTDRTMSERSYHRATSRSCWMEREIAQWIHSMKDRSDDRSCHEWTLLPRSYILLLLAGTRNSSMDPLHEGSIRRPIVPWARARARLSWTPPTWHPRRPRTRTDRWCTSPCGTGPPHRCTASSERERKREMFYLTMHSTHFIYGYMEREKCFI